MLVLIFLPSISLSKSSFAASRASFAVASDVAHALHEVVLLDCLDLGLVVGEQLSQLLLAEGLGQLLDDEFVALALDLELNLVFVFEVVDALYVAQHLAEELLVLCDLLYLVLSEDDAFRDKEVRVQLGHQVPVQRTRLWMRFAELTCCARSCPFQTCS